jgi:hypothetical protein
LGFNAQYRAVSRTILQHDYDVVHSVLSCGRSRPFTVCIIYRWRNGQTQRIPGTAAAPGAPKPAASNGSGTAVKLHKRF